MLELKVKKLTETAKLPEVAHEGEDLGYDWFSDEEYVELQPGEQKIVSTGIACEIDPVYLSGHEFKVGLFAKQSSGIATKRLLDVKAGVVDAGYRNEVKVVMYNYGNVVQQIYRKDKLGQLCPALVLTSKVIEVDELSDSSRGIHGFGSGHKG